MTHPKDLRTFGESAHAIACADLPKVRRSCPDRRSRRRRRVPSAGFARVGSGASAAACSSSAAASLVPAQPVQHVPAYGAEQVVAGQPPVVADARRAPPERPRARRPSARRRPGSARRPATVRAGPGRRRAPRSPDQSVLSQVARPSMHAGDRGLQRVRAERPAEGDRPVQRGQSVPDQQTGPSGAGPDPAAAPSIRSHRPGPGSATPAAPSAPPARRPRPRAASARRAPGRAASPPRPGPGRSHVIARGGRVALVEDQVDDLEHHREPRRAARRAPGPRTGPAPRPASAWPGRSAVRPWPTAPGYARAISSVDRPPSSRRVSATRDRSGSTGWQATKIRASRSSPIGASSCGIRLRGRVRGRSGRPPAGRTWPGDPAPAGCASIALCLAVAVSQAPGLSGTPCSGHCSRASTNASCASSSASPTSRTSRASVAISRGDSIRQTASMRRMSAGTADLSWPCVPVRA